jgi:hypothetical protein
LFVNSGFDTVRKPRRRGTFRRAGVNALLLAHVQAPTLAAIMGVSPEAVDAWAAGEPMPRMAARFVAVLVHAARRWRRDLYELAPNTSSPRGTPVRPRRRRSTMQDLTEQHAARRPQKG